MMAIENIIDNISRYLKKDPSDVRKKIFMAKIITILLIME